MTSNVTGYPVEYDVVYPEGKRNRLTTLFRFILGLPAMLMVALVTGGGAALAVATGLMILFRGKYPRAWFDWQVEIARLSARFEGLHGVFAG